MKRVTAFVGSARKKGTFGAVLEFLDRLKARGDVETEIVRLSDCRLEVCRGCKQCFERGEEACPLKDDRDLLLAKMRASDGVVFASPTYSFQVSGLLKVFLDRLGFAFHRPRFFGKTFTSIVTQSIYGGRQTRKYLDFVGGNLGFNTVKGSCLTAFEPMTEKEIRKFSETLADQARRFHERMTGPPFPVPSLLKLMVFRMGRTSIRLMLDERSRDFNYYRDKGWFESDYFYPTRLGSVKRAAGFLFDSLGARAAVKR